MERKIYLADTPATDNSFYTFVVDERGMHVYTDDGGCDVDREVAWELYKALGHYLTATVRDDTTGGSWDGRIQ